MGGVGSDGRGVCSAGGGTEPKQELRCSRQHQQRDGTETAPPSSHQRQTPSHAAGGCAAAPGAAVPGAAAAAATAAALCAALCAPLLPLLGCESPACSGVGQATTSSMQSTECSKPGGSSGSCSCTLGSTPSTALQSGRVMWRGAGGWVVGWGRRATVEHEKTQTDPQDAGAAAGGGEGAIDTPPNTHPAPRAGPPHPPQRNAARSAGWRGGRGGRSASGLRGRRRPAPGAAGAPARAGEPRAGHLEPPPWGKAETAGAAGRQAGAAGGASSIWHPWKVCSVTCGAQKACACVCVLVPAAAERARQAELKLSGQGWDLWAFTSRCSGTSRQVGRGTAAAQEQAAGQQGTQLGQGCGPVSYIYVHQARTKRRRHAEVPPVARSAEAPRSPIGPPPHLLIIGGAGPSSRWRCGGCCCWWYGAAATCCAAHRCRPRRCCTVTEGGTPVLCACRQLGADTGCSLEWARPAAAAAAAAAAAGAGAAAAVGATRPGCRRFAGGAPSTAARGSRLARAASAARFCSRYTLQWHALQSLQVQGASGQRQEARTRLSRRRNAARRPLQAAARTELRAPAHLPSSTCVLNELLCC